MTDLVEDFIWDEICQDAFDTLDCLLEENPTEINEFVNVLKEEYDLTKDQANQAFDNWWDARFNIWIPTAKIYEKDRAIFVRCEICNEIFVPETNFTVERWCSYDCASGG